MRKRSGPSFADYFGLAESRASFSNTFPAAFEGGTCTWETEFAITPPREQVRANPPMNTQETCLPEERDIHEIDSLLCAAQSEIGLSSNFCANENRPKRLAWLQEEFAHNLLWVIRDDDGLAGVLILKQDLLARVIGIAYIVVAARRRRQREIGPKLVQKAQELATGGFLKAEARNNGSRRLLERCGFEAGHEYSLSGHPILIWSKP